MDKIIYKKRDWVKGELITEEKIDNIEIGIEQADKTIDQFKDEFSPMKTKNDLDEARVDIWSNTFSSLKQRLDSDYFDIAKDAKIYKNYSLLNREDSIRNTADGNVSKILVKGRTENDIVGIDIVDNGGIPRLNIRVRKSDLESNNIESLKRYLANLNAKVYCELENYIEHILDIDDTSIEDPILILDTYLDQTELKMENNVCPIFEGSVSISLVSKIDKNRESNEEIKEQISTLESDLDIINENIDENNNEQMANDLDLDMRILELELMKDL